VAAQAGVEPATTEAASSSATLRASCGRTRSRSTPIAVLHTRPGVRDARGSAGPAVDVQDLGRAVCESTAASRDEQHDPEDQEQQHQDCGEGKHAGTSP